MNIKKLVGYTILAVVTLWFLSEVGKIQRQGQEDRTGIKIDYIAEMRAIEEAKETVIANIRAGKYRNIDEVWDDFQFQKIVSHEENK